MQSESAAFTLIRIIDLDASPMRVSARQVCLLKVDNLARGQMELFENQTLSCSSNYVFGSIYRL